MEQVPVHNDTDQIMYVAGRAIPPGESRHFTRQEAPHLFQAETVEEIVEESTDNLALIAGGSVPGIEAVLPNLSDDDLDRLEQLEIDGKARVTALRAITEEKLNRAQAQFDEEVQAVLALEADALIAKVPELATELLKRINEVEIAKAAEARVDLVEAIDAELQKREQAGS